MNMVILTRFLLTYTNIFILLYSLMLNFDATCNNGAQMSNHYRVLAINGSGVRGIVPASILKELVSVSKRPIHKWFDFVIGTSIGGIIAVALTVKDENGKPRYTAEDVA
jgi:predicted acylesterase/phospholipase RssA